MKERPILFSGSMVRAILEGRKTVTRRVIDWKRMHKQAGLPYPSRIRLAWFELIKGWGLDAGDSCMRSVSCPYGQPRDRLWVRETWMENHSGPEVNGHGQPLYRASWGNTPEGQRWKPSIFMPRWACRINLEITGVKVERLRDITDEQAIAEGIELYGNGFSPKDFVGCWKDYVVSRPYWNSPIDSFHSLWESINGAESWALNPWVWAVSFQRIQP